MSEIQCAANGGSRRGPEKAGAGNAPTNWGVERNLESYQDLRVGQGAMQIARACYFLTRDFPKSEHYSPHQTA